MDNKAVATHIILTTIDTVLFIVINILVINILPYRMFVAESAAHALAAFHTATLIVGASVLAQARSANAIAAAIADIPHPFYWNLFATTVAGNYNVCHIFVVLFIVQISIEILKQLQSGYQSWFSLNS